MLHFPSNLRIPLPAKGCLMAAMTGFLAIPSLSMGAVTDADAQAVISRIGEARKSSGRPPLSEGSQTIIANLVDTLKGRSNEWALSHGVQAVNVWGSMRVLSLLHPELNVGSGTRVVSYTGGEGSAPMYGTAHGGYTWGGSLNGTNQYIEFLLPDAAQMQDWALGYAGSRAETGASPYAGYVGVNLASPDYLRISTEDTRWQSVQFYVMGENPSTTRAKVKDGDIKFSFVTLQSSADEVIARNDAQTSNSTLADRPLRPRDISIGRVNASGTHSYSTTAPRWLFLLSGQIPETALDSVALAVEAACRDAELQTRYSVTIDASKNIKTLRHNNISWSFEGSPASGQFANGEWWVQGPVKLLSISPGASQTDGLDVNGSMINPSVMGKQGFDGRGRAGTAYDPALNIAKRLPLILKPGESLVSTLASASVSTNKKNFDEAAVITVLAAPPAAGSFRPPYFGSYKPLFNTSQLKFDVFRKLKPTASASHPWTITRDEIKEVRIDLLGTGGAQANTELSHPKGENYGRSISGPQNRGALLLNLDYPNAEKKELLVELVQRGLDTYGGIVAGFRWDADGGHRHGRKLPMYIAGKALGSAEILEKVSPTYYRDKNFRAVPAGWPAEVADYDAFQEGQQHFYITKQDVELSKASGILEPFTDSMIGMGEWKPQAYSHVRASKPSSAEWASTGYRWINGRDATSVVLITSLMGDRKLWGHEAMFDYVIKRYYPMEKDGGDARMSLLTREMWEAYFNTLISRPVKLRQVE